MGAFQLPDSVLGAAIGCLIYSFVCLFANCLLVWLIWEHRERTGYVAFISYFSLLATASSLVQQVYDYAMWRDIMTWQFHYGKAHLHDAEVQYQNSIFGLKLGLSYLRIFSNMVEVSLVFFFSMSLAATVYGWWAKNTRLLRTVSIIGRVVPIVGAVISVVILQLELTHKSFVAYLIVANAQFVFSLIGSLVFLLLILTKYIQSRIELKTWGTLQYGKGLQSSSATRKSTIMSRRSRAFSDATTTAGRATFDRWLVMRLTIAFLTLCVFEWTNIHPHLTAKARIVEAADETAPDLSEARAMKTVTGYLSGVSPSLLAFIVFGTTKTFQRKLYRTFVPKFLRRKQRHRMSGRDDFDFGPPSEVPFSSAFTTPATTNTTNTTKNGSTAPPSPQKRARALSLQFSRPPPVRKPEPALGPINEAGCVWLPDSSSSSATSLRRSQIGLALASPPPSAARQTFLRPEGDSDESDRSPVAAAIPMSRFYIQQQRRPPSALSGTSTITTQVWSEGQRASAGTISPLPREGRRHSSFYGGGPRGSAQTR